MLTFSVEFIDNNKQFNTSMESNNLLFGCDLIESTDIFDVDFLDSSNTELFETSFTNTIYVVDPDAPEQYTGSYNATSRTDSTYQLNTKDKVLTDNITVYKIPYWLTSNLSDGKTAYIGMSTVEI